LAVWARHGQRAQRTSHRFGGVIGGKAERRPHGVPCRRAAAGSPPDSTSVSAAIQAAGTPVRQAVDRVAGHQRATACDGGTAWGWLTAPADASGQAMVSVQPGQVAVMATSRSGPASGTFRPHTTPPGHTGAAGSVALSRKGSRRPVAV
jgi:hypothetical protein